MVDRAYHCDQGYPPHIREINLGFLGGLNLIIEPFRKQRTFPSGARRDRAEGKVSETWSWLEEGSNGTKHAGSPKGFLMTGRSSLPTRNLAANVLNEPKRKVSTGALGGRPNQSICDFCLL